MVNKKITTMVRFDEELISELKIIANLEHRSLNGQMAHFLKKQVDVWNIKRDKTIEYSMDYEK